MADTYGVQPNDVAAELPGIFPGGFSALTKPTDAQVAAFITTADTIVTLRILDNVGQNPSASDRAAPLAKRYIIEWTKAQATQVAYAGNDPVNVAAAVKPYQDNATQLLAAIDLMGAQAEGEGLPAPHTLVSTPDQTRCLLLTDCDLNDHVPFTRGRF